MIEQSHLPPPLSIANEELLEEGEVIVIVDDFADIVGLLEDFLHQQGFATVAAGSADALRRQLGMHKVALALLDIEIGRAHV